MDFFKNPVTALKELSHHQPFSAISITFFFFRVQNTLLIIFNFFFLLFDHVWFHAKALIFRKGEKKALCEMDIGLEWPWWCFINNSPQEVIQELRCPSQTGSHLKGKKQKKRV